MKLSEISFENLSIGDRLLSARGRNGKVTKIDMKPSDSNDIEEDNRIWIEWEGVGNKTSLIYHYQGNYITYIGP
ncbi:MAG: hypothetical protein HZA36_03700 [Parcubacteria group bacterium]|nr:hypothetical protein [Parcubacteria group bacterium]